MVLMKRRMRSSSWVESETGITALRRHYIRSSIVGFFRIACGQRLHRREAFFSNNGLHILQRGC